MPRNPPPTEKQKRWFRGLPHCPMPEHLEVNPGAYAAYLKRLEVHRKDYREWAAVYDEAQRVKAARVREAEHGLSFVDDEVGNLSVSEQ